MSLPLGATTFKIQPVSQQLGETDGVVMGHYLKSKAVRLDDGKLATQMHFKMKKEQGLQSDLFEMDEVIIHYPGGKMEDEIVEVQGVPQFVSGEKVVIFIKSVQNRYWGMNLGMGSYKIVNYGNETIMVNSLFPHDAQIGQIHLDKFEKMVKEIKGKHLKVVKSLDLPSPEYAHYKSRSPASIGEGKKRTIASENEEIDNKTSNTSLQTYWFAVLFAFLGGFFRYSNSKGHKK